MDLKLAKRKKKKATIGKSSDKFRSHDKFDGVLRSHHGKLNWHMNQVANWKTITVILHTIHNLYTQPTDRNWYLATYSHTAWALTPNLISLSQSFGHLYTHTMMAIVPFHLFSALCGSGSIRNQHKPNFIMLCLHFGSFVFFFTTYCHPGHMATSMPQGI